MARIYLDRAFWIDRDPQPPPIPFDVQGAIDWDAPREVWCWEPADEFLDFFAGRRLIFGCYRTTTGHRVFVPLVRVPLPKEGKPDSPIGTELLESAALQSEEPPVTKRGPQLLLIRQQWELFVGDAVDFGVAVLNQMSEVEDDTAKYHAVMSILSWKARHTEGYLSRHFLYYDDLRVKGFPGRHILPNGLGEEAGGAYRGWGPDQLLVAGRDALEQQGRVDPPTDACIAYGLYTAANLHPAQVPESAEDRRRAIRVALFTTGELGGVTDELLCDVGNAFYECYHRRAQDDTQTHAAFYAWAGGERGDNIFKLVRGRVQRATMWRVEQIDAAIAEWCWRSIRYAGGAMSAACSRFLTVARQHGELTTDELALFELMYCCHPAFGGMTLLSLIDRFDVLKPWLERLIECPNQPHLESCYTLLGYYTAMVTERRLVDTEASEPLEFDSPRVEESVSRGTGVADIVAEHESRSVFATRLAGRCRATCRCPNPNWDVEAVGNTLWPKCTRCGERFRHSLTFDELRSLAADLDAA